MLRTLALCLVLGGAIQAAQAQNCAKTVYLTFDTGSQSQAEFIAGVLKKHQVKATFFLANEKTVRGDFSLDASWAGYWQALAQDGHAFGTHTFDHVYLEKSAAVAGSTRIQVKPQFGAQAGQSLAWSATQFCAELQRSQTRFEQFTGQAIDAIWRAPGGRVNAATLQAAKQCGFQHVGWAAAGFLGDELPSQSYPNAQLLSKALSALKNGDIAMAHLGIWSRQDAWAPAVLEPLIVGLKAKNTCFATLRDHPAYRKDGQGAPLFTAR